MLRSGNFEAWRDTPGGTLSWLWGNGGFGKSFLMSAIIEHLESPDRVWSRSRPHIIYFFCRKGDEWTSMGKRIFLHLLIQLYEKAASGNPGSTPELQEKCSRVVEEAYKQSKSEDKHDSSLAQLKSGLLPMFEELVKAFASDVFVLVDGLDECQDYEDDFLQTLLDLPDRTDVHMMISSRPDIFYGLRNPVTLHIEVSANQTQAEIAKYVKSRIKGIKRFTAPMRKKACERIAERSEGSFRYANVVLDSLYETRAKMTPFTELLDNLPSGMNALYRRSMASLDSHQRRVLIVALRWLMCSSGQVTLDLIADELECRWENVEEPEDLGGDGEDEDASDYADFESDSEESILALVPRESTPFGQNWATRDIEKDLKAAGREFLRFDGQFIEIQHNSIRDFVLAEEEAIKHEIERCGECRKRFQETIAYEAGPKEGNLIICRTIIQRLNNPAFQKEHIIREWVEPEEWGEPEDDWQTISTHSSKLSQAGKEGEPERGTSAKEEVSSPDNIPDVLDDHIIPSKEDIIEGLGKGDKAMADGRGDGQNGLTQIEQTNGRAPHTRDPVSHTSEQELHQAQPNDEVPPSKPASAVSRSRRSIFISPPSAPASRSYSTGYSIPLNEKARYELTHWPRHFRQLEQIAEEQNVELETYKSLYDDLEKFLRPGSEAYLSWLRINHPWRKYKKLDSPLHIAARYGIQGLLERYVLEKK
ncbi:uncharacterized protein BDR25DRAFT_96086 [Lindgomyces ingoldianus]|uniref:Uncharacterized protein n=1 Tax=Lindgomyces ingoldianus TaxID=673940 RepID=A0ACB6QE64_9PLEO|nr:uncharacterized protein BDR25DRAFT_96086 [Lindgomyces ingoldianus]KAF2464652.1 hypothetical protein BDR25DRAFT_96086 [Lindgomyces ingoldianus]